MNNKIEAVLLEAMHTGEWLHYWQLVAQAKENKETGTNAA